MNCYIPVQIINSHIVTLALESLWSHQAFISQISQTPAQADH